MRPLARLSLGLLAAVTMMAVGSYRSVSNGTQDAAGWRAEPESSPGQLSSRDSADEALFPMDELNQMRERCSSISRSVGKAAPESDAAISMSVAAERMACSIFASI